MYVLDLPSFHYNRRSGCQCALRHRLIAVCQGLTLRDHQSVYIATVITRSFPTTRLPINFHLNRINYLPLLNQVESMLKQLLERDLPPTVWAGKIGCGALRVFAERIWICLGRLSQKF